MESFYKKCVCCGKYFLSSQQKINYCSDQCKSNFIRCIICGNYFEIKDEKIDIENYVCSKECSKKYIIKNNKDKNKLDFSKL